MRSATSLQDVASLHDVASFHDVASSHDIPPRDRWDSKKGDESAASGTFIRGMHSAAGTSPNEVCACIPGGNLRGPASQVVSGPWNPRAVATGPQCAIPAPPCAPSPRRAVTWRYEPLREPVDEPRLARSVTRRYVALRVPRLRAVRQCLAIFRMLLDDGRSPFAGEPPLLQPATAQLLRRRRRVGFFDHVQGIQCDWGLGLFVGPAKIAGNGQ